MFKRILVPLDGSKRAERSLPVAMRLARACGGSITLLRVVSAAVDFWPSVAGNPALAQEVVDSELAAAVAYLAAIKDSPEFNGITTETIAVFGQAASTILEVTHSQKVDLIVLCSHGYTGMKRWVMGSVAEKVAYHAPVPVLVLREAGAVPADLHPDPSRPLRALVPLDGSSLAKAVLEPVAHLVASLAAPSQGMLHLVRVVKPPTAGNVQQDLQVSEEYLHKARTYLRTTVEHLREGLVAPAVAELKLPVTWSVAVDEDVTGAIVRVAENGEDAEGAGIFGGCDLIAIATHGRGGVQRWAMGSITQRVLVATTLPLLIVRPTQTMDKSRVKWDEETIATVKG